MKPALKRKNFYLDTCKLKKAQKILGTKTETETIDKALGLIAFEKEILLSLEKTQGRGKGHIAPLFP